MRLFTLDEARRVLPDIREAVRVMHERKQEFDRHRQALAILAGSARDDGDHLHEPLARHREAAERLLAEIQTTIEQLHALGVEVKGIDQGLVDFPTEREGRVVYLCWMLDEPDIAFWHDLNAGFRGRQPL